jgi:CheY-like chemotaxis protein/nitrogen-specific signal transduction histidine kinase
MLTLAPGSDPATGEPVVFGFGTDITSLKHTEAALIKARDEAQQASRAKSLFLSSMSHELRTPMNAVLGFAQLLANDAALNARQRQQVEQIRLGGSHLLALINDLLDLARIESDQLDVQLQPLNLANLAVTCMAMVADQARQRQVQLILAADLPDLAVQADPRRLQQVLINLLDNAIKYNRTGGWVKVGWALQDGRVRCSVRDSGPGIAVAQQARLFQLFERLDAGHSAIEGSGIGLALCRRLLALMHGEIGVDSLPGSGSTFWFELDGAQQVDADADAAGQWPAPPEGAGASDTAVVAPWAPPPGRPWRVLCIEDNPVNLMLIEAMLAELPGLLVQSRVSPVEGLACALADPPDLVLLDIQMPDLDGYQVLAALRADSATCRVPVIAASADAMPQSVARGHAAGFAHYLTKPLELASLLAAVQSALADHPPPR